MIWFTIIFLTLTFSSFEFLHCGTMFMFCVCFVQLNDIVLSILSEKDQRLIDFNFYFILKTVQNQRLFIMPVNNSGKISMVERAIWLSH